MSESPGCCRWCTGFLFSAGLTALFMWLSLRPSKPSYSIESFYIPALNKTANDTRNSTIFFQLLLKNGNKEVGIYYDDVNVTLSYIGNRSFPVGNVSIRGFRQGHKKKACRKGNVSAVELPWETARREASSERMAVFRAELATEVRYRIIFWKTRHHKMKVEGNITVNNQGTKSTKKGVKLSCAPVRACYCAHVGALLLSVSFLLWV